MEYSGNSLLGILGKDRSSREFQEFRQSWNLNAKDENNIRGIKVFVNPGTSKVESILFAGDNYTLNNDRFTKYSSQLPFGVSLTDNPFALSTKLGAPVKLAEKNELHFSHQDVAVEVAYNGENSSRIYSVKYYNESGIAVTPKVTDGGIKSQPIQMASIGKPIHAAEAVPAANDKIAIFKKAIMDVFKAYRESAFFKIKGQSRAEKNFWNYKYTYSSNLKIPGEKFSMLYSYPFASSDLDYVSVIKEADNFDKSFETTYHEFEKRLQECFPAKDGWIASCIPNKESKTLSDLELRNDRYGAIVLDYCRNPKGKHILYMRFLLFSN